MTNRLIALAFQIADSAARADIECLCVAHGEDSRTCWYDLAEVTDPENKPTVDIAAEYLRLRCMLWKHPKHKTWVRPADYPEIKKAKK